MNTKSNIRQTGRDGNVNMRPGNNLHRPAGRHLLQIPGPTPIPDRILRAMDMQVIDHRGPEFQTLARRILGGIKSVFKTRMPVVIYPASGTGAWEAALVNTLSPGDRVLMCETGHFATVWKQMAINLGLAVDFPESDWRDGADPGMVEAWLRGKGASDQGPFASCTTITSTGCTS